MLSFNQRKLSTCKYVVTMQDCIVLSLLISNMLPKCINLRQIIFKISVKICTEIYSPSRGEDYNQQLETCIIESIIKDILQRIFIIISIKKNIIKSRKSKT